MRQLSIRSKIIVTLLLTGLACLAVGGVIGDRSGTAALTDAVGRQLTAQREIKRLRIESYIRNQLRFTEAVGAAPQTTEATLAFMAAFHDMHADLAADPAGAKADTAALENRADTAALEKWYDGDLLPRIDKVAGSHTPLEGLMPADPVARRLQADYIARNPNPVGEKDRLTAASGGSRYDAAHARYHPVLKRAADTVGFYDINIMDAATGDVVYTVAKETDFASNMYHGPFARSGFARAAQRALDPKNGGRAVVEDYTAYMPSAFAPQMFAAVPIIAEGQTIAVFVAQIDIRTLNNLLTDNGAWEATGQGATGEVQLVGEDRLLRSQSRFLATEPEHFLAQAEANGLPVAIGNQIRTLGTTILYMPDHNAAVEQAFHNETGVARFLDSRGVEVVSAYGPVEVAGLRWAIQAKQDVAEAFAPAERLNRNLFVAAAAAAIVLTLLALACAGLFLRPLRRVIAGIQQFTAGKGFAPLVTHGDDEFAELGRGFNAMAGTIAERDRQVEAANAKADGLLRSLYPAGLAERMRSGVDVAAETVANVTVAVTWMDGLDALAVDRSAAEIRDMLNLLLETINGTAESHGVEPVRSLGESHFAVCGLSAPRLDHATRTLAWTQSAATAVQRLGAEWSGAVSLRFGLASGEIDVLLLNRGLGAYDIWGRTLGVARRIVLEAAPGSVRVDESTFTLLTDAEGLEPAAMIEAPVLGALQSWTRPAVPPGADARSLSRAAE